MRVFVSLFEMELSNSPSNIPDVSTASLEIFQTIVLMIRVRVLALIYVIVFQSRKLLLLLKTVERSTNDLCQFRLGTRN